MAPHEGDDAGRSAAAAGEAGETELAVKLFGDELGQDVLAFGRHSPYENGTPNRKLFAEQIAHAFGAAETEQERALVIEAFLFAIDERTNTVLEPMRQDIEDAHRGHLENVRIR